LAQFEFARRSYQNSESLARRHYKRKDLDKSLQSEWHQLLAFSLVRQGKYDLARPEYDQILGSELSSRDRQVILFRLGLMALDDKDFVSSAARFRELRSKFPSGIYQESSHWFEAWSIFQIALQESKKESPELNRKEIESGIELLERLPRLPEGDRLAAQALYWKSQLQLLLGQKAAHEKSLRELKTKWEASFHSLLATQNAMNFALYQPHFVHPKLVEEMDTQFRIADPAFQQISWKRVEAFASAHLFSWAQLELQTFFSRTGSKNLGLQKAVARRLKSLGDWSDLIRYAQNNFPFELENLSKDDPIARLFYPQAYHQEVLAAAQEFEVSPFLIWGVMREESRFQSDVISHAGAVGLLQLMPSLASQIARQLKEGKIDRMGLTKPERNIRYGTQHLKDLLQQAERLGVAPEFRIPLVVASYNAGMGPVRRWTQELDTDRLDVFVESIPFTETRNYVKRVLQSAHIYYILYGERVKDFAESNKGGNL
jgi:soluble lytic murein transglycosylase-like protein